MEEKVVGEFYQYGNAPLELYSGVGFIEIAEEGERLAILVDRNIATYCENGMEYAKLMTMHIAISRIQGLLTSRRILLAEREQAYPDAPQHREENLRKNVKRLQESLDILQEKANHQASWARLTLPIKI